MPSLYEYFVARNEEWVDLLTLYGVDEEKIEIVEPARSWRSGTLGSTVFAKQVTYQKHKVPKLKNLSVVNKNGQYHTTVWTTTPDGIKMALRMGIFSPKRLESPIAKLIACYGQYKKLVFQRKEERGLVSSKNNSKLAIVDFAQDAIAQLQPIYECINRYDASKNPHENVQMILGELKKLDEKLNARKNSNLILKQGIAKNRAALAKFSEKLSSYQNKNRSYIEAIMRPTGLFCLGNFLQEQLETINETARKANNAISGLYNRGELFDAIHEAEVVCRQMPESPDYHNPAPKELSLSFGDEGDMKEQKTLPQSVVLDLNKQGAAVADHSGLVLQLKLLAQIEQKSEQKSTIEERLKKFESKESSLGMFWSHWSVRGMLRTVARLIVNVLLFPFDVLALPGVYSVSHLLGYAYDPQTSFYPSEWIQKSILAWLDLGATGAAVLGHPPVSSIEQRAFISQVLPFLTAQLAKLTWEPLVAIGKSFKEMYKIGCRIYYDFTIGREGSNGSVVDEILEKRLPKSKLGEKENPKSETRETFPASYDYYYEKVGLKQAMKESFNSLNTKRKKALSQGTLEARTPYHLHFDEPHDLFSGGAAGIQAGCQVFLDEIYHRHPAAAMGFTVAAALGGLPAVCAALPNNFPFIKAYMTHFSNFLGEAVVGNTQGIQAGISLALLEGKLAFLTLDFFKRGPESVLFHALQGTLENPTVVGLGLLSTYGIGCLIAHSFYIHVSIPYMTQRAKTSLECPLPIETAVWGAKFATLVYEILFDVGHHASSPAQSKKDLLCSRLEELLMPVIKEKIEGLDKTVGSDIISGEAKKAAAIYVEALLEFKTGNDKSLQKLFSEHRLNLLDETTLSDKEKYQILRWAEAEYGEDNPHYVAALQGTLYPQRQSGPLATSIRILFSYPLNFVRMILSGATYLYDRLWQEKAHSEARLSLQGWNEFWLRKVPGDVGLVIRASHKVIKYTFLMAAAFSLSLVMLAANVVCGLGAVVEMLCRLLCCKTYQPAYSFSLFKAIIHTAKTTGNFLTQPKFFTHLFQAVIGWFRQPATHKHLHLVSATDTHTILVKLAECIKVTQTGLNGFNIECEPPEFPLRRWMCRHPISQSAGELKNVDENLEKSQRDQGVKSSAGIAKASSGQDLFSNSTGSSSDEATIAVTPHRIVVN